MASDSGNRKQETIIKQKPGSWEARWLCRLSSFAAVDITLTALRHVFLWSARRFVYNLTLFEKIGGGSRHAHLQHILQSWSPKSPCSVGHKKKCSLLTARLPRWMGSMKKVWLWHVRGGMGCIALRVCAVWGNQVSYFSSLPFNHMPNFWWLQIHMGVLCLNLYH